MTDIMSHSQFHRINRLYLDMHGLILILDYFVMDYPKQKREKVPLYMYI